MLRPTWSFWPGLALNSLAFMLKIEFFKQKKQKHPGFSRLTLHHDIGMLVLSVPVIFNTFIQPACLPPYMSNTYPGLGVNAFAAGWGLSSTNFTLNILQNVRLTTLTESSCPYQDWLSNTMMCAGKKKTTAWVQYSIVVHGCQMNW